MTKSSDIAGCTTGIGSLPPAEESEVLDRSFSTDIPYFPSLPSLGLNETMLGQGLAGFPEEGPESAVPGKLWNPYLERLALDPRPLAKLQMVGPITASRSLAGLGENPELRPRLEKWLLRRAEFMLREVQARGKMAIFFWDEPELLSGDPTEGLWKMVEALREKGALVGIHCCAAGDLSPFLDWPLDLLSFDFSLASPWEDAERLWVFRHRGGRLALGVVPTVVSPDWHPRKEAERCRSRLKAELDAAEAEEILRESLLTPACGLGFRTVEENAAVFAALAEFRDCLKKIF